MPIKLNGKIVWNNGANLLNPEAVKEAHKVEQSLSALPQTYSAIPQTYSGVNSKSTSTKSTSTKVVKAGGNAVL
ncbi:MAG: hypothetical protein LBC87_04065 [Fibromonadaceae bacterium]|jgi:hypothetical protein|nr:hypothetical protein [Fibromonadaceae bacterium]